MGLIEDSDGIGADDLLEGQLDSRLEVHMLVNLRIFNELHEHLGIRIGFEGIALLHESCFEYGVVLDDTIMDDRQALRLGIMRMGIDSIGFTVRSPTGMGDTDTTFRIFLGTESLQFGYLTFGFIDIELSGLVDECDTRTVVSAVLETMQTFY